jgi:hypothetical protein
MEPTVADPLVEDYLRRLEAAAVVLTPDRREDLLASIREHLDAARTSGEAHDEASTRALLDRLGEPAELVAAAGEQDDDGSPGGGAAAPGPVAYRRPGIGLEVAAALLLTAGSIVAVVGWLVGVVLVWTSRRWTLAEKLLATLVVPGGPALALWLSVLVSGQSQCTTTTKTDGAGNSIDLTSCEPSGALPAPYGLLLFLFWVVAPIVVAGILVHRARVRADREPPVAYYPGSQSRWGALEIAAVLLLGLGSFVLPFIGGAAGLMCAWLSDQWTRTEKWVATVIAVVGFVLPILVFVVLLAAFGGE